MSYPDEMARVLSLNGQTRYEPYLALRLHRNKENHSQTFIEYAPIEAGQLPPLPGEREPRVGYHCGTYAPLPQQVLQQLGRSIVDQQPLRLPAHDGSPQTLFYAPTSQGIAGVLFEAPAAVRFHQFGSDKFTGAKDGDIAAPRCVFMGVDRQLHVFAVANDGQPLTDATQLLVPPMLNVNVKGSVCVGSTELPKAEKYRLLSQWQSALTDAFFLSKGTHEHTAGLKATTSGRTVPELLRQLYQDKVAVFPDAELLPVPETKYEHDYKLRTVGDLRKHLLMRLT